MIRGDLQTPRLQLAAASRCCLENGCRVRSRTVQKIQVLSHTQSCLKSRPQQPPSFPRLSEQKTVLIGKGVLLPQWRNQMYNVWVFKKCFFDSGHTPSLRWCTGFSLAVARRGYSPAAARRLLLVVAFLVSEHRLSV